MVLYVISGILFLLYVVDRRHDGVITKKLARPLRFRSSQHLLWFISSMAAFSMVLALYGSEVWLAHIAIWMFLAVEVTAIVLAILHVLVFKNPNKEMLSEDCIWFNLLMVIAYAIILKMY